MKMVITIMEKLYRTLKKFTVFSITSVLLIVINIQFIRFEINGDFISLIITMVSIVFGFLIMAVCNLFGRKITKEMSKRPGEKNIGFSQLQELKADFLIMMCLCIFLMILSVVTFVVLNSDLEFLFSIKQVLYGLSAIYISMLLLLFLALFNQIYILLNMMVNESNLDKKQY